MIQVTPQWSFYFDDCQCILIEHRGARDKPSFHADLPQAMEDAARRSSKGAKSFKDITKRYHELQTAIRACTRALELKAHPICRELQETKAALRRAERQLKTRTA